MKKEKKQSSLQVQNMSVSVGGSTIVKRVSFVVKPGEVHVLMGPNGSGKSTLLNVLAGHPNYTVESGIFSIDNKRMLSKTPDERARAGLFLAVQHPVDIPGVRVATMLRQAVQARNSSRGELSVQAFAQELRRMSTSLQLNENFASRMLNVGFSGGERKKCEVLQLAILQPKYALLDEIDSGLDVDALKSVAASIKEIQQKRRTGLLIVSHNSALLEMISPTHVHVMIDGRIAATGGMELATEIHARGFERYLKKRHEKKQITKKR